MSTASSSSQPSSPAKPGAILSDVFKPNPHPYAIKTTSTGVLSRSTSSVSRSHNNHYVPSSPSPSPTKAHFPEYSERGSRHRYSRSLTEESIPRPLPVPPDELYEPRRSGSRRSRADILPSTLEDGMDPKSWTFEQLSANVPEIADFIREHEITGRAFLRFDDGVLDAYGITSRSRRSLILSHSRRLKQSMLHSRVWPNPNTSGDFDTMNGRSSLPHDDEDDPAYLSSSSSISSVSSISGRMKRRVRPNSRVLGMVTSYERSTSPDKSQLSRERSGSISSVDDEPLFTPQVTGEERGRPLPSPPQPTGGYVPAPFLLSQQTSFPNSFRHDLNHSKDGMVSPQVTGNRSIISSRFTDATGPPLLLPQKAFPNDVSTPASPLVPNNSTSPSKLTSSRPLPATPLHPSLRPPPIFDDDSESDDADEKKPAKNKSGEMTMDELIGLLNPDNDASQANSSASDPHLFVNTDRRKRKSGNGKGAAAWEVDVGDTVKHVPPRAEPTTLTSEEAPAEALSAPADDEMTVEELLALEGDGAGVGVGAAAWVGQPQDAAVQTMKRIEAKSSTEASRIGSIGRKSAGRISLSAGRKSHAPGQEKKRSVRRVGQLFASAGDMGKAQDEETQRHRVPEMGTEEMELERMRVAERELLRAEEEERLRWDQQVDEKFQDESQKEEMMHLEMEREALRRQEEYEEKLRVRQVNEERLRELFQRQKRMEEDARRRMAQEAEAKERRAREEADAARRRQEDAERRLSSSIQDNRRLLEELRARLDEVEHRIAELETASNASPPPQGDHPAADATVTLSQGSCLERRLRMLAAWALATPLSVVLPAAVSLSLAEFAGPGEARGNDDGTATTVSRRGNSGALTLLLPRYALFFGIGLCAVVLRGLMRWGVKGVRGMGAVGARGVRGR
ncbi:hypothetical protein H0H92_014738 [Tricholoma furcatifolium]|nr:hypothetical protein H0H92_014738 [Tricholoma furcatifolium]